MTLREQYASQLTGLVRGCRSTGRIPCHPGNLAAIALAGDRSVEVARAELTAALALLGAVYEEECERPVPHPARDLVGLLQRSVETIEAGKVVGIRTLVTGKGGSR